MNEINTKGINPFSETLNSEPSDGLQNASNGWDAYYNRLKRQQKLTAGIEADNEIQAYLRSPECRFDETTFRRCDEWAKKRFGFDCMRGDALNGHDLKQFDSPTEYARTVLDVIKRGTQAVATPQYVEAIKAKAQGEDALDKYLGVEHTAYVHGSRSTTGATMGGIVDRTPEEIAREREEKFGKILSQNFIAVYEGYNDTFDFTPEETKIVASAVRSRDGLKDEEQKKAFELLAYENPERAAIVLDLIKRTKKDQYGWMRDAFFEVAENWKGQFGGLWNLGKRLGERIGTEAGFKKSLDECGGQYYWNDEEKAMYGRLNADFSASPKRGVYAGWEATVSRDRPLDPMEAVNWRAAARMAEESLPAEERKNRRRAELMLEEASKHAPIDHGFWYSMVVGGVSTIPYILESSLGPVGFAGIALNQFENTRDQILMAGGDPDEAVGMQLLLAAGWAAVEKMQFDGIFGKPLTALQKKQVLMHVADTAWKKGKLKAVGNLVRAAGPEFAFSNLAELTEEGLQGAVEKGTIAAFSTKDAAKTISAAMEGFATDFRESVPTMLGLTAFGTWRKYKGAKKHSYDVASLSDFAAKYVRSVNILRNTLADPEAAKDADEKARGGWKNQAAVEMWNDCAAIWRKHLDERDGGVAALDEIREKYALDDEQIRQVGEALDLRENLLDTARRMDSDDDAIRVAGLAGGFRVGNDTTYDPVDLLRLVNPEIRVEDVEVDDLARNPTQKPVSPETQELRDRLAAAQKRIDDAKVGSERRAAEREYRRVNRKLKAAEAKEGAPTYPKMRVRRVTVPVGQSGETRSFTITENAEGPDIHTAGYAVSVANAMKEPLAAGKAADGAKIATDDFKRLPSEEKMTYAVTPEQYMAMTENERDAYCRAWTLKAGGTFSILDDKTGKEVFGTDALVQIMRAFRNPHARVGGNWTLAHEYGHAISEFARAVGIVKTDSKSVAVMRRLFGDPRNDKELWNEEAANDGFANWLRNKYDFRRMTPEERKAARGFFRNMLHALRGIFSLSGRELPDAPVERTEREQALDAAYEAMRTGDFAGLDAFAGIDFAEDKKEKTNPELITPNSSLDTQQAASAPSSPETANDTPAAPKTHVAAPEPASGPTVAYSPVAPESAPLRAGTKRTIFTPDYEMSVEADVMWVPLASLVESTDDREVQMRDRSRVATDQQVLTKTRKGVFQPLALFPGSKSDDGAPIVGGGLRIISGHGRKRMLDQLVKEGRYGEYLAAINAEAQRQGLPTSPEDMENPVLVSRVTGGLDRREDLTKFAERSNRWGGLERSGAERAVIAEGDAPVTPDPANPDIRHSVRMAMKELADGKEKATLRNESLGNIEYNIGRTGKKGFGLLHIVEQRMLKDGATLEEAVDTAINVATAAEIGEETEARHNTHHLDYNGTRAIIGVMPDKSIVITGYEIYAGEPTVAKQRAAELSPRPHVRLDEVVRVLKEKLASAEEIIAQSGANVNGEPRYSLRVNPNLRADVARAINTDSKAGEVVPRTKVVEMSDTPDVLLMLGYDDAKIITRADILRKIRNEHFMSEDAIAEIPNRCAMPVAVFRDGENVAILTDGKAMTRSGAEKPVMVYLRPAGVKNGKHTFMASAYAREPASETAYVNWIRSGEMLYLDIQKATEAGLEEGTISQFKPQAFGGSVLTPDNLLSWSTPDSIANPGANVNAPRYSVARVTPEEDAAYMDAVRRGDMETARRMAMEAAGKAGVVIFDENLEREGEYKTLADLYEGLRRGELLVHARRLAEGDVDGLRYGIDPEVGETLQDTEAYRNYEENGIDPPALTFASEDFSWGNGTHAHGDKNAIRGDRNGLVFVRRKGFQKCLGDGKVMLDDGRVVPYGRSPVADYDDEALRDEPAYVERGDWYTKDVAEVVGVVPFYGKSADGVTYDDAGNVIPLSQRFDPANPDVRYSVRSALGELAEGNPKAVIHNAEYGDIEYWMGRFGKRGFGLAHIVESRMEKDGDTLDVAVDVAIKVAEAAAAGTVTKERYNTKHFDLDGVRAIVAFNDDGNKVITGYEISADASGGANRRPPSTRPEPHVSLEEIVSALKSKLALMPTPDRIANPGADVNGASRHSVRLSREEYALLASEVTKNDANAYKAGVGPLPHGTAHTFDWGYAYDRLDDGNFIVTARWRLDAKNGIVYWQKRKAFLNGIDKAAESHRADHEAFRSERGHDGHDDVWPGNRASAVDDAGLDGRLLRRDGSIPEGSVDLKGVVPYPTTDIGRADVKPAPRHSVRSYSGGRTAGDLAAALIASRRLAGKDVSAEDADRIVRNLGLSKTHTAAEIIEKANALADRNREKLRGMVERSDPALVATLARQGYADSLAKQLDGLITGAAAAADPDVGAKVQQMIQSKATRDLVNAHGFTAAQMMAELPVDLAQAVFAVAEYEKTPEERAEELRMRNEELGMADGNRLFDYSINRLMDCKLGRVASTRQPTEEALAALDDPAYREPTEEERANIDELLNRARFAEEARKAEEERKKAKRKRKESETGEGSAAGDSSPGGSEADLPDGPTLPLDTVRRIAPVFESADLFASFIVEWTADHVAEKHPNIPNTAEMWKNPVAVRELKQTATHILRRLAKDVLGSPSLNYARNFADHAINELESDAECRTFNAVRRKIARVYDQIHDNALKTKRRDMVKRLAKTIRQKAVERGRFSAVKEDLKRKIDAKTEQWCRWLVPALTMSEEKLQDEISRLTALVSADPADEHATPEDKLREAADHLAVLHKYGGMVRWMPGRIADAEAEIMEQLDGKRQAFEQRREERKAKCEAIVAPIVAAMQAGSPSKFRDGRAAVMRWLESMQGNIVLEMQALVRFCPDENLRREALQAIDELAVLISEGESAYNTELAAAERELHEGLKACYGDVAEGIHHLLSEKLPEEAAKGIFKNFANGIPTYGQLLQLYAETIQSDYRENAEKHGRTAALPLMEATMTDADRRFHAFAVEWYRRNGKILSPRVEAVTGLPIASPDALYTPARMERIAYDPFAGGLAWNPIPSQLNRRIPHELDFAEDVNFFNVMLQQCKIRAQTVAFAERGLMLRDTIASHDLRKTAAQCVGKEDVKRVVNHVRDILVQGADDTDANHFLGPINVARRWVARTGIAYNAHSVLMQGASIAVLADVVVDGEKIGLRRLGGYLSSVGTEEGRAAIRELVGDMGFKARYEMGWSEDVQNVLRNPSKNRYLRYLSNAYDYGFKGAQAADKVCSLWMAQGLYRDLTARYVARGMAKDEAKRKARALTIASIELTQQTSRISGQNALMRKSGAVGSLARLIFQFKSAQLLANNFLISNINACIARPNDQKCWVDLMRSTFIVGGLVPAYTATVEALWRALMGEKEPPEDEEEMPQWFRDFVSSMFEGVAAPMFFVGQLAETAVCELMGSRPYRQGSGIPTLDKAQRMIRYAVKAAVIDPLYVEEGMKWEAVKKDLDRLAKQAFKPYAHVKKAIENRTEERR